MRGAEGAVPAGSYQGLYWGDRVADLVPLGEIHAAARRLEGVAVRAGQDPLVAVLSGGNIDPSLLAEVLST